jgi:hypothetical protein
LWLILLDLLGAEEGHGLNLHVTTLQLPVVVVLEQHGANEIGDAVLVGEDTDDVGSPLDLLVEPLERVRTVQLGSKMAYQGYETSSDRA